MPAFLCYQTDETDCSQSLSLAAVDDLLSRFRATEILMKASKNAGVSLYFAAGVWTEVYGFKSSRLTWQ
jgi:hypothetical protein